MKVAVIGSGIMGVSLGYLLSSEGAQVDIYEAFSDVGGLAGPVALEDGTVIDRYYHAILSGDSHLRSLCREVGIEDRLRFRETKMAFYYKGAIHSMNNTVEFLRFPPLGWVDRFRLGLTLLAAGAIRDWRKLEATGIESWLMKWGGRNAYATIWKPLLRAKFDGDFNRVPATWIWSRVVRMRSTRAGASQKEEAGHIIGGYPTLLRAMARRIEAKGGHVYLNTPVQEIVIANGVAQGVRLAGEVRSYDAVIATVQTPLLAKLAPAAPQAYRDTLAQQEYLGVVCPILVLDRPLSGYWTLNIADEGYPFTGVIETTTYIDPQHVGGHHLVYLPKYTAPGSEIFGRSDEEIRTLWLRELKRMFPSFDPASIRYFLVNRSRQVEPLHFVGGAPRPMPAQTPVERLYLASTAQIYPELSNGEAVTRHARRTAETVLHDLRVLSAGAQERMPGRAPAYDTLQMTTAEPGA